MWSSAGLNLLPGFTATITVDGVMGTVCVPTVVSNTTYVAARDVLNCAEVRGFSNGVASVIQPPVLGVTIVKTQTPASPASGAAVTYRIVVANTGTMTVTSLTVTDTVSPVVTGATGAQPAGFGAAAVTSLPSGTLFAWGNDTTSLAPGRAFTFTITGVAGTLCADTPVSNSAYVVAAGFCGSTAAGTGPSTGFVLTAPVLTFSVVYTQTGGTAAGGAIRYQIAIRNLGTAPIDSLTVVDTLSPAVQGVTTIQPGFPAPAVTSEAGSGTRYVWSVTGLNLLPAQTVTITVDGVIGTAGCSSVAVSNTAFVVARNACTEVNAFSNPVGSLVQPPVLSLTAVQTVTPASPATGVPVTLRIVVTNTGTAPVTTLAVVDTIPALLTGPLVPSAPAGFTLAGPASVAGGTLFVWEAAGASLAPGASFTFTITGVAGVVAVPTATGNTAFVTATGTCASAAVTMPGGFMVNTTGLAQLAAVLTVQPWVQAGQHCTVLLTVSNTGTGPATVSPTFWVTIGASLVSVSYGPWPPGPVTIAPGTCQTFWCSYAANTQGTVEFAASGSGTDTGTGLPVSASATVSIPITPRGVPCYLTGGSRGVINPAAGQKATFWFRSPKTGRCTVIIYNLQGWRVWTGGGNIPANGSYGVTWNCKSRGGSYVSPGAYAALCGDPSGKQYLIRFNVGQKARRR